MAALFLTMANQPVRAAPMGTEAVVQQLETAWNADDITGALTLFSTDPEGWYEIQLPHRDQTLVWSGPSHLASFLGRLWHAGNGAGVDHITTMSRRVTAETVFWSFRTSSDSRGEAVVMIRAGEIISVAATMGITDKGGSSLATSPATPQSAGGDGRTVPAGEAAVFVAAVAVGAFTLLIRVVR
jgi:hypothetical protein